MPISPHTRLSASLQSAVRAACLLPLFAGAAPAQDATAAQPASDAPIVKRVEGVDAGSGIRYLRLSLALPPTGGAAQDPRQAQDPPRLTMECRDNKGKHDLLWYLSLGGIPQQTFEPPFHPTDTDLFPPRLPRQKMTMFFEGYMQTKPYVRTWLIEPSGELRYCNPGMDCPNIDGPSYFLTFLNALPGLRIRGANPLGNRQLDVLFQTRPLLDAIKASPVCAF